jgi:hypothetical protein
MPVGFDDVRSSPWHRAGWLGRAFLLCLAITVSSPAYAEAGRAEQLVLSDQTIVPYVTYDKAGGAPIEKAAELLAHDLNALSGRQTVVAPNMKNASGTGVIIGTADSPVVARLLKSNHIDTASIRGKWETYGRAVIPAPWDPHSNALLIFGSDTRGTIWGVIDLTREIGVSAWEWWADVTIRKVDRVAVNEATFFSQEPSVRYRGFFLNAGENGLNPWAAKTYDPAFGNIGPKTYARVYELLWRLKANLIWPAMTIADTPFNATQENAKLAADYAIVRGSSHVEMLLRNNPHEWDSKKMGPYSWLTNRDRMIQYWRQAVHRFGAYENLYTVGLRNIDDFPMVGADTPRQMANILSDVIVTQRKILSEELHKPANQIPQVFTLYKEILPAYDTGLLKIPDDIILNWAEDDFGYIRRLSNAEERRRSGGSGVYYHNVFWGPPMSYLWLDASNPSLMWEEMAKAHQFDARKQWVLNVGSIKPCEFMTELFLAMAFDVGAFKDASSVKAYLGRWVAQTFGEARAADITGILWRYYKLAFDRNPEFMAWTQVFPETPVRQTEFNMLHFGDENARRVAAYRDIMTAARQIRDRLPADRKDAFFQLVQYPADMAGDLNIRQLSLDKSITYGLQHRASANVYSRQAGQVQENIDAETREYNEVMSGGKWHYMMSAFPHDLPIYEKPHLPTWDAAGDTTCGVQTEGGAYFDGTGWWTPTLPQFHSELDETRYIDVFVLGDVSTQWSAAPDASWVSVDKQAGSFSPGQGLLEDRVHVSINWSKAPPQGKATVLISCGTARQPIGVHVELARANTSSKVSFIEAEGIVSMFAANADELRGGWEVLEGLGHTDAGLRSRLDTPTVTSMDAAVLEQAPKAVYRFATTTDNDRATLRVIGLPVFPVTSDNGTRVAVSIDGGSTAILDLYAPEFSQAWREHALSNTVVQILPNLHLGPGAHTLEIYALDPGVVLDRLEIDFDGAPRAYAPVPETRTRRTASSVKPGGP